MYFSHAKIKVKKSASFLQFLLDVLPNFNIKHLCGGPVCWILFDWLKWLSYFPVMLSFELGLSQSLITLKPELPCASVCRQCPGALSSAAKNKITMPTITLPWLQNKLVSNRQPPESQVQSLLIKDPYGTTF